MFPDLPQLQSDPSPIRDTRGVAQETSNFNTKDQKSG
jgi:hypothetical protein